MSVVNLPEPHIVIECADGVHVLPVSLIRDVIAGRKRAEVLTEPVLQKIIQEWLEQL